MSASPRSCARGLGPGLIYLVSVRRIPAGARRPAAMSAIEPADPQA
jgi:hypothetical protein